MKIDLDNNLWHRSIYITLVFTVPIGIVLLFLYIVQNLRVIE